MCARHTHTARPGARLAHIPADAEAASYQPMNIKFGLFPPLSGVNKKARKEAYTDRAKSDLAEWRRARASVPA